MWWMWDDHTKESMEDKVARAIRNYTAKFNLPPDFVYVLKANGVEDVGGIRVEERGWVLENHFILGRRE